jgi:hypothetical protein
MNFRSKSKGWRLDSHRHYLAAKGVKTKIINTKNRFGWRDNKDNPKNYILDNVRSSSSPDQKVRDFKNSLRFQFAHSWKDMDKEWQEYTAAADNEYYGPKGKPERLSNNIGERAVQRGAATFARVVSQANMEMFIDGEKDRTLRESTTDFVFGRRLK